MTSRRALRLSLALLVLALALWLWRRAGSPPSHASDAARETQDLRRLPTGKEVPQRPPSAANLSAARVQRDALRAAIEQGLARSTGRGPDATRSSTGAAVAEGPQGAPGKLRDRVGGRDALVKALNHQFMPLAQDCIARAQAQRPSLQGMLALALETLADEEHGAVVDIAQAAPNNEIVDADLWECIRESAYSLSLPPPPSRGREAFVLTLPLDAVGDLGSAASGVAR